jgi:hypothetical protein
MALAGGVSLPRLPPVTPARCVQRLRLAVEQDVRPAIASLSRGRIALPPRAHRMRAFDAGGGEVRVELGTAARARVSWSPVPTNRLLRRTRMAGSSGPSEQVQGQASPRMRDALYPMAVFHPIFDMDSRYLP